MYAQPPERAETSRSELFPEKADHRRGGATNTSAIDFLSQRHADDIPLVQLPYADPTKNIDPTRNPTMVSQMGRTTCRASGPCHLHDEQAIMDEFKSILLYQKPRISRHGTAAAGAVLIASNIVVQKRGAAPIANGIIHGPAANATQQRLLAWPLIGVPAGCTKTNSPTNLHAARKRCNADKAARLGVQSRSGQSSPVEPNVP